MRQQPPKEPQGPGKALLPHHRRKGDQPRRLAFPSPGMLQGRLVIPRHSIHTIVHPRLGLATSHQTQPVSRPLKRVHPGHRSPHPGCLIQRAAPPLILRYPLPDTPRLHLMPSLKGLPPDRIRLHLARLHSSQANTRLASHRKQARAHAFAGHSCSR
jgi:hypothetical protein